MNAQSFGAAVGRLIYQRRKALGLTQTQLAEDAFETSGKTRRISELENGLVANPHPRTLDPILAVLSITDSQIEECARQLNAHPDPDLDHAYREARNLIEAIARQFEHSNPSSTFSELDEFLRGRAREWRELRERINQIDSDDSRIESLKVEASGALSDGELEKADACLAEAECLQQSNATLVELRKLVNLRVARADIHILAGKPQDALQQYHSAVNFLVPFSEKEAVDLLNELAYRVYESGRRSLRPQYAISASLLERILDLSHLSIDEFEASKVNYRLSLIYRNLSVDLESVEALSYVEKSIEHAEKALLQSGNSDGSIGEIFHSASIKISLSNALLDKSKINNDESVAEKSIKILRSASSQLSDDGVLADLKSHVYNSLGSAIMTKIELTTSEAKDRQFDEAVQAFKLAVDAAEACCNVEVWGVAKLNIGMISAGKAKLATDSQVANFSGIQAISALHSALETYPAVYFPIPYAQAHYYLANALFDHGMRAEGHLRDFYLMRAIASYEAATEVFDKERHPLRWAGIQMYLGSIFAIHAEFEENDNAEFDYGRAVQHLNEAKRSFKNLNQTDKVKACQKALTRIKEKRGKI